MILVEIMPSQHSRTTKMLSAGLGRIDKVMDAYELGVVFVEGCNAAGNENTLGRVIVGSKATTPVTSSIILGTAFGGLGAALCSPRTAGGVGCATLFDYVRFEAGSTVTWELEGEAFTRLLNPASAAAPSCCDDLGGVTAVNRENADSVGFHQVTSQPC